MNVLKQAAILSAATAAHNMATGGCGARTISLTRRSEIQTNDVRGRKAVGESFVSGYRATACVATGLALARSLSAATLISGKARRLHGEEAYDAAFQVYSSAIA